MRMTVYGAENNDVAEDMVVTDLDVVGEIVCRDCGGTELFAEPEGPPLRCTTCKGKERVLVAI